MSYFKNDEYNSSDISRAQEYINKLGKICLDELMLSSDAYICMIKLNMQE